MNELKKQVIMQKIQVFVMVWGVIMLVISLAWGAIAFIGPIRKMEQNNSLAKSSLNYYSKKTFLVETCTVAVLMAVISVILIMYALVPKAWMGVVAYILIALGFISALGTAGYFGYTFYHMKKANNSSMSNSLALWEEKFGCCGWDVFRPQPLCASDIGSLNHQTCQSKTKPIVNASLQNTIAGGLFLVLLFVTVILSIILQSKTRDTTASYSIVQ